MVQEGALTALASVADSSQVYVKKLCCICSSPRVQFLF